MAFLTDTHIQRERGAAEKVSDLLCKLSRPDRCPDLIVNGGDLVMDALAADMPRLCSLWSLWEQVSCPVKGIPILHCLGNHDIWGWSKKSGCAGTEPLFGRNFFLQRTGLISSFYTVDFRGWRFIVLDSMIRLDVLRYAGRLDAPQRAWLESVLASTPAEMPVAIVSHIPIMGGPSVFLATAENTLKRDEESAVQDWTVPTWQMHADALSLIELFAKHGNVRLCLSGHTHIYDFVSYRGIGFINGGAVSGQWWRGDFFGTPPGYVALELFTDGSYRCSYVPIDEESNATERESNDRNR